MDAKNKTQILARRFIETQIVVETDAFQTCSEIYEVSQHQIVRGLGANSVSQNNSDFTHARNGQQQGSIKHISDVFPLFPGVFAVCSRCYTDFL